MTGLIFIAKAFGKLFLATIVLILIGAWSESPVIIGACIIAWIIAIPYFLVFGPIRNGIKIMHRMKDNLVSTGFNITHLMESEPLVAFDHANRKFAFVGTDGHRVLDYKDVRSWNHEWVDRNGSRLQNTIVFNLNDIDTPVINAQFRGNVTLAEQWYQRLDVMLNAETA